MIFLACSRAAHKSKIDKPLNQTRRFFRRGSRGCQPKHQGALLRLHPTHKKKKAFKPGATATVSRRRSALRINVLIQPSAKSGLTGRVAANFVVFASGKT